MMVSTKDRVAVSQRLDISIVMPAYNVESYIGEAIESVLNQGVKPAELIIVNDGSSDGTDDVIKAYEAHPLVTVVRTQNQGLGPARNRGLEQASGEYIYFFDSDDIMDPAFIKTICDVVNAEKNPDLIAFSGNAFPDNGFISDFNPNYRRGMDGVYASGMDLYKALLDKNVLLPSACLYVTRRAIWIESGLRFKAILHEDQDILFPLYLWMKRSAVVDRVLFHRRVRANSIMTSDVSRKNAHGFEVALETMLMLREEHPDEIKQYRALWRLRVIELLTLGMKSLLSSGQVYPSGTIVKAYLTVFGPLATLGLASCYIKRIKFVVGRASSH